MTAGARSGLEELYKDFGRQVTFVSVYVREAHPGENYPHHASDEQKMHHASSWTREDDIPWTVAVDTVDGLVHSQYGVLPNPVYIIDKTGHVAFRALWAGQEGMLRDKLQRLTQMESQGKHGVNLGEQENLVIPLLKGAAEFDRSLSRGGRKSQEDFRREMGNVMYTLQKLISRVTP